METIVGQRIWSGRCAAIAVFGFIVLAHETGLLLAGDAASERLPGPKFSGLGHMHHPVTTASREAQAYFNQGMSFLFGFNHKEAIRSFRSAAFLDADCAMAHWGIAYAHGPHVNRPMEPEDTAAAWKALQRAEANAHRVSEKERAYIQALKQRYQVDHQPDRLALDKAFAQAMRELVRTYPDDLNAQTLFAESLMNTMPWDYWTRDRTPKPETEEILAALRTVMSRDPDHPGANHFFIHAVEAGPTPELGLAAADRLLHYAPGLGHLVHMPAHIYMRVGQYEEAIRANEWAVKADRGYLRHCRAEGFYPGVYYPHNLHFLWWAQLFEGRSRDALRTAKQAAEYAMDNYCGPRKVLEAPRLRHLPWLTLVHFGRWDEVLASSQPPATNDFLVDRAMWHFSRGLAYAAQRNASGAEQELIALSGLALSQEAKQLSTPAFPVADTLQVANHWLAGRVAGLQGNQKLMRQRLEQAVSSEDSMPYMEPSYWPVPARQALGAALLKSGEPDQAERIFREDLRRWPRNGRSLFGLEKSLLAQGKTQQAEDVRRQFQRSWKNADVDLQMDWF
jgi:tetratricopeptide (TPR) repeat protein